MPQPAIAASTARSVAPPTRTLNGPVGSTLTTSPSFSNSHSVIVPLGKRPHRQAWSSRSRGGGEHLTKVRVEAARKHEAATEDEEAEVDIVPAFVADSKSAELVLPGLGPFHDPSVGTESLPGFDARTDEESMEALEKSTLPRRPNSSSNRPCNVCHTPVRVHSSSLRKAVMPDRPNCLRGNISQGMPLRSTKTMASSAARSSARGRPSFFLGRGGGSKGATRCHEASGTSSRTMPLNLGLAPVCGQSIPDFR